MTIRVRDIEHGDLAECLNLLRWREPFFGNYMAQNGILELVPRVWSHLLTHHAVSHGLVEDLSCKPGQRIFNFGFVAFVKPEWKRIYLQSPLPVCGREVLVELDQSSGRVLLPERELRTQNSEAPGLIAINALTASRPARVYQDLESVQAALAAYLHSVRGFRIGEVLMEGAGEREEAVFLSSGSTCLRKRFENLDGSIISRDDAPVLVGLTRLEANEPQHRSAFSARIFEYHPPIFGFTPLQQALLRQAIRQPSDNELLVALEWAGQKIERSALARRWDRIFRRVSKLQPKEMPVLPGSCGTAAKRSRVLLYVAQHYEELRPYEVSHPMPNPSLLQGT